jgi:hypothetical protein
LQSSTWNVYLIFVQCFVILICFIFMCSVNLFFQSIFILFTSTTGTFHPTVYFQVEVCKNKSRFILLETRKTNLEWTIHSVRTFQKSNRKIRETEANWISLTHIYMIDHFPRLVRGTSIKSGGVNLFYGPKPPLLVKCCGNASVFHV